MLGHDEFYIKSPLHETLLSKISKEIKQETIANRAGDSVKAVKHGQKVWDYLLQLMKIVGVDSIYELERSDATEYDLLFWAATFADELYSGVLKDKSIEKQELYFYESYVDMHRRMLDRDVRNLGQGLKALNIDDRNDIKKRLKDLKTEMQRNVSSKK
jgi:hypothetical protein